jgi:hypothetical protein
MQKTLRKKIKSVKVMTSPAFFCLPPGIAQVSQNPSFLDNRVTWKTFRKDFNFTGFYFIKTKLMQVHCFLLLEGCLFSNVPAWSQGCAFVWSQSLFMECSCALESLGYFNYRNYHVLGPFGLTRLLSFLSELSCVCLHRKCTLS